MKNPKKLFHSISYLQYPFMAASFIFYFPFIKSISEGAIEWEHLNYVLIIFGVAISFSTLQDTTKVQNTFSKKVWEDPKKGKIALIVLATTSMLFIALGFLYLFVLKGSQFEDIGVGLIVLGIGLISMLKAALELFDNHRKDKNTSPSQGL